MGGVNNLWESRLRDRLRPWASPMGPIGERVCDHRRTWRRCRSFAAAYKKWLVQNSKLIRAKIRFHRRHVTAAQRPKRFFGEGIRPRVTAAQRPKRFFGLHFGPALRHRRTNRFALVSHDQCFAECEKQRTKLEMRKPPKKGFASRLRGSGASLRRQRCISGVGRPGLEWLQRRRIGVARRLGGDDMVRLVTRLAT